jgi:peptide/nickel transport system permease protein
MKWFLARRLGQAVLVAWLVSLAVFVLTRMLPGGAAKATLGKTATPEQIAHFNHQMKYDRPILTQYQAWISRLFHGDLGYSYKLNQSVSSAIGQALPKTALLIALSIALSLAVALPLGIFQGLRKDSVPDRLLSALSFLAYATPSFFLGLMLILLFAVKLHLFPANAPSSSSVAVILSHPEGLVLPVVTLAAANIAMYARYMRSAVVETLTSDHVRTARAKGLSRRQVIVRHVAPNSLTSIVTLVGLSVPGLLAGSVIVEQIFNYPGMGLLFWTEAQYNDYPTELAIVLIVSTTTVLGNLMADVGYQLLDPRVSLRHA